MPLDDRDYIRGKHPPNCACVECTRKRLEKIKQSYPNTTNENRYEEYYNQLQKQLEELEDVKRTGGVLSLKEVQELYKEETQLQKILNKHFRNKRRGRFMRKPDQLTNKILTAIAIIFAVLTGISIMAWLLPSLFNGLGETLVRITGNPDIMLNVERIRNDPIFYSIVFGAIAISVRWLAGKF